MPIGAFRLNTIANGGSVAGGWLMYNTGDRASNITPGGFDVDSTGNIYILDTYSSKLAKLNSTGTIVWQKYVSTPSDTTSKGDGGLLSLNSTDAWLICALQESSTSISLCQFNTSTGALITKAVTSVAAGNSLYLGNVVMGLASSTPYAFMTFGATVGGVNRMCFRKYTFTGSTLNTTASSTNYHLASGATNIYDCRYSYNTNNASNHILGYQNYVTLYNGHNTISTGNTRSFTGSFDSIAADNGSNYVIMKDNIIAKYTGSTFTKSWEYTHTINSVGGSHYYNQGLVVDSSDNIYACYWNSTAGKIVIYKVNASGVLQWTKSITLTGYTNIDAMTMKIVGTDLYLAFKYGNIGAGGMAILKIPTDGTGTKTFANSFILANETGSLASSTNFSLATNTPATTSIALSTAGRAFTVSNATLPTYTQSAI